ncbi:16S rRNA (cytosine(1402)-N(4))-methyltransferase RsmH [Blochmannia endosymbiont of Colobopsis nipponica]|uniref:16S rRNA (cytosine(1402)-N(4))-methyltransferase RsmH n=1 Tax=Blochmannia endosymbiont of Colobopsis nipponica TaxID=2681987 RepID=UPI00177D02C8|nr:16S rRNA (cytosine(1402)-N(4))-methyltransferase RsmH [Blochmannia endosymbiont of Colobopsis nipponica]QOI11274.1 16S rRNA (cytosine(1402)-N(4))-methyltransferase RsmH [Blochmannia endosymbiont of Colobopsis nipponica]
MVFIVLTINAKYYKHVPVLLKEVITELDIRQSGFYCDATFGRGGHAREILSRLNKSGRLLVIDCDLEAVKVAKSFALQDKRLIVIHGFFSKITKYAFKLNISGSIRGILLDLGVSSPQIEDPRRGFSFRHNGPLDMRMNNSYGQSASDWIAKASVGDIAYVLRKLGEERFSSRIAKAIVRQRHFHPITTTHRLASLVIDAIPYYHKHPLARTFRAIRMYINRELEEIMKVLESSLTVLSSGGKLLVTSFHSLEDRIVKDFMYKYSGRYSSIPVDLPVSNAQFRMLSSHQYRLCNVKKIVPSEREKEINPRARSAIMRIAEKL